jgi:hypothetical protein
MSPNARAAAWAAAGIVVAAFWVLLLDGFFAGALAILTLVGALLAAFLRLARGQ